ncbi:MAG TPA: sigma-70 family RNA polymerase sigma factor [Chloroflexi bacterium]|nr:sigma-70 family RNA polymerase sigma factor [Chloroflexota bacterium]
MFKGRSQSIRTSEATPVAEASEEALLAAAMQYDEAALGELYDRYEAKIYAYIYRRTGDEALAEDFTAQVFLRMLESIRDQKAWHSSFSGWLYRIAHNLVIDHYRRKGRQGTVDIDEAAPTASEEHDPEVTVAQTLDAERLRAAIRRLTDEQAEVVSLRFLEGYSISEVATMMNRTEGAIKALQYRAVATLRNLLYEQLH